MIITESSVLLLVGWYICTQMSTFCLTLFNLKYLAVTEKSITFAKELTITIKIGGN